LPSHSNATVPLCAGQPDSDILVLAGNFRFKQWRPAIVHHDYFQMFEFNLPLLVYAIKKLCDRGERLVVVRDNDG
jgi:hypothetical protein